MSGSPMSGTDEAARLAGAALLAHGHETVLVLDRDGCILFANAGPDQDADGFLGHSVHDDLGGQGTPVIAPEALAGARRSPGTPRHVTGTWPVSADRVARLRWSITCIEEDAATPLRFVAIGVEDAAGDAALAALDDSRAHLRAVLDTAVDGIITIDEHGTVLSMNGAAERIFGYDGTAVVGRNVNMLMPSDYARNHDDHLRQYLRTGEARIIGRGREVEGLRADGSRFPMELAVSEVRSGATVHFTGFVRDITDRRRAQTAERKRLDELAHASRLSAMGEMTSGIAHELNQPLAAMVTFAKALTHMLDAGSLEQATLRESLDSIASQGLRAGGIVSRLRRLARKDTGQYEEVDVNAVVTEVLALVAHELRLGQVSLNCELASDLPTVQADRIQIEQVVLNLARNAVDAMSEIEGGGGHMDVATTHDENEGVVQVVVRDTGPGIEDDALPHVFDSFFTTKPTGIGLGLSISRSIMDAHGGQIRCENAPGGGARFILRLPLQPGRDDR